MKRKQGSDIPWGQAKPRFSGTRGARPRDDGRPAVPELKAIAEENARRIRENQFRRDMGQPPLPLLDPPETGQPSPASPPAPSPMSSVAPGDRLDFHSDDDGW